MSNFQPFANIRLKHPYFGNSLSTVLSIVPSKKTAEFMKQVELVLKPDASGAQLFHSDNTEGLAAGLSMTDKLIFFVVANSPLFWQVTELPMTGPSHKPLRFIIDEESIISDSVVMTHSTEVDPQAVTAAEAKPDNLVGTIEIDFEIEGELVKENYEIRFATRKVYWRYYFMSVDAINFSFCQVESTRREVLFSTPVSKKLENGGKAYESMSLSPILLSPRFDFSNYLIGDVLGLSSKLKLPTPDPNMLNREEDGRFVISMYVYV